VFSPSSVPATSVAGRGGGLYVLPPQAKQAASAWTELRTSIRPLRGFGPSVVGSRLQGRSGHNGLGVAACSYPFFTLGVTALPENRQVLGDHANRDAAAGITDASSSALAGPAAMRDASSLAADTSPVNAPANLPAGVSL